jgi:acetyl coenzyme A synthetase (ADP forming)-like protein
MTTGATHVRPLYLPPPYQDSAEAGRLILRDGSTATVRVAQAADAEALRAFFGRLSPESRYRRFFSVVPPDEEFVAALCDNADPSKRLTLVVLRTVGGAPQIIATASYLLQRDRTAEVAFAVEDPFQGRGLGTLLLERLALLAARCGITRFWATTHADNVAMIEVFRHSGFELREQREDGSIEVDFGVQPSAASVEQVELRDQVFTAASLRPFFRPNAVAVIGASREPSSIGYRVLEALVMNRFQGPVYPVNPKAPVLSSIRAYPSVGDVPEAIDLAVIVVPRDAVLGVVDDCAARGVRALIVISAGFAETGAEGAALQRQLVERVRGHGMRLIGPNCLGLINTDPAVRLNASFSPVYPPEGRVAMLSQSGALGIAILALAGQRSLGLSNFVSVGNKADVSGNDLLQYWEQDPATAVILLYLESFGNPRRFSRIARRVSQAKPIVVVKGGRTKAGGRAAGSHTAALAASDVAVEALFAQTGVIHAERLEEMFEIAAVLSEQPLPTGRRVGIVTNAGGPGILCADACETVQLSVPEVSAATRARLAEFLPASASLGNPVDMIASASPEHYRRAVSAMLACDDVDSLIVIYIPVGVAQTGAIVEGVARGIREGRAAGGAGKPVLACMMGEGGPPAPIAVDGERIPAYVFPESAAHALGRAAAYAQWRGKPQGVFLDFDDARPGEARAVCRAALAARGAGWLTVEETRQVLQAMGLPLVEGQVARSAEEAAAVAAAIGFPVAVKLASHRLVHKTEVGGVMLNLRDEPSVRAAYAVIESRVRQAGEFDAMDGVLVQRMLAGGVEVMVGVTEDPSFGPLIAFGLGGIHVEILRDVVFRVAPLTDRDAREMIRGIRGWRLLEGYRGHPAADIAALEELLLRVSLMVEEVAEIGELDFNPIFAFAPGQGCRIADARLRVR